MASRQVDNVIENSAVVAGYSRNGRQWSRLSAVLLSVLPYRVIRVTLALIFLWSGLVKLAGPTSFAVIIASYGLIPDSWNLPTAVLLAALEALVGFALLLDIRGSLAAVAALLVMFTAILGYGIRLGLDIDCGCFGPEDPEAAAYQGLRAALRRDAVMGCGVIYLYLWRLRRGWKAVPIAYWVNPVINRRRQL